MRTAELDYDLPDAAIAQVPVEPRDTARLLCDQGPGRAPTHRRVRDLPDLVRPGDVIVINDTRVRAARVHLRKSTGGAVEVLLLEPRTGELWEALIRPSRKVNVGTWLGETVEVVERLGDGRWLVAVHGDLSDIAEVPLPPYIREPLADPERYQTVFARREASVAAPTAGLHLTNDVIDRCRGQGARVEAIELVVGLDTFRPVTVEDLDDHAIHTERYEVPAATMEAVERAERVIAIGTTVVRALESAGLTGSLTGRTDLFIRRGYDFRVVDALVTNFHVPRSTLLALIDAFIGPRWRDLYAVALAEGYRFLSFGDAMYVERR